MNTLINDLMEELKISEEEAVTIIKSIAEYIENQHPVLKEVTRQIVNKELEKNRT